MKRALLRFGKGFKVRVNHRRSQAATMTLARGEREGDPGNTHRGADQWLFVVREWHGSGQWQAVPVAAGNAAADRAR
jgi:hypothetical protein